MPSNFSFFEDGYITTRCYIPNWSIKSMDKTIDTLDVSVSEVNQLLTIDEMPQPDFLMYDIKVFIPKDIIEKVEKEVKEIHNWFDIDKDKLVEIIRKAVPSDKKEIADWMHDAMADNILINFITENYNQSNNSYIIAASGDGFIPGVGVDSLRFISEISDAVERSGFARLILPDRTRVTVPWNGGKTIIKNKLLGYAHAGGKCGCQWNAKIFKWKSLANTLLNPVRNLVCLNFGGIDGILPQFFEQVTRYSSKIINVTANIWSKVDQRIHLLWRDPRDYTKIVHRDFVDVNAGLNQINASFGSYPHVPPLVCHVSPEKDKCAIRDYGVEVVAR